MRINIWSCNFDIPTKHGYSTRGYLDKTWDDGKCPVDINELKVGNRINYRFPDDWRNRNYICRVKEIKPYLGEMHVQVEVMNIRED